MTLSNEFPGWGEGGGGGLRAAEQCSSRAKNGRDFPDESDALLSPMNQPVYTLGDSREYEGWQLRWTVVAAVLKSVSDHALQLREEFGAEAIDIMHIPMDSTSSDGADCERYESAAYVGVRLLVCNVEKEQALYQELCRRIVEDILSKDSLIHSQIRPRLLPLGKRVWLACTLGKHEANVPQPPWEALDKSMRPLALMLRGLLCHEVLAVALRKRWRVAFGVHPIRTNYKMAVPFTAKDVAAERTEYGHPDINLLLTNIHYYQQGLTEEQLRQV
ncbi:hypothetical protein CYMTET_12144 [Cymbomonas tetramitiformis]|uniref:ubiquitinyl hydrolase 1 n=1 Tax=Cymbomonas tetramitiformis TaxID=36881 RepID=A0AAE0GL86_9CHLO|nr:hypothetical protein CYMTET_12144 [Cymbomonas tetramitiformis]